MLVHTGAENVQWRGKVLYIVSQYAELSCMVERHRVCMLWMFAGWGFLIGDICVEWTGCASNVKVRKLVFDAVS